MSQRRSRSPSQDFSGYIKGNCKQLLGTKFWDTRFISRVDVGSRQDKLEAKILVLSKFRIFILSGKAVHKLHVESAIHLLSLRAIEVLSNNEVKVSTDDGKRIFIRIAETNATGHELACEILKAFKHYFPGCNDTLKLFLELRPPDLYVEFVSLPNSRPALPCNSFRRTYAALCDFYKLPFRDEVVWDVEKIYSSHNSTALRMDDFTHLYPKDLIPIVAVLQFSQWFSGIVAESIKLIPELLDVIISVIRKSQWLRQLRLRNCGISKEFIPSLCQALELNPTIPLETLDLSRNSLEEHKPLIQLGNSLAKVASGLIDVRLGECGLNSKAINGVANGLFRSQNSCDSLRRLCFASNTLKDDVIDVHNLLSHCSCVEELDFSYSSMPLEKIWSALKYGGLRLITLKLAGCFFPHKKPKDPQQVPANLKDYFASTVALKHLDFCDTTIPPEVLKCILLGLACNQAIDDIYLSLTRSLDAKCVTVLETSLPSVRSVSTLVMRDNAFNQDLSLLLPSIARMSSLHTLDLGGNNFHLLRKNQEKILPNVLMELVKIINDEDGPVRSLILSECRLGVHLSVVLNALGVCPHLKTLDLSANDIGNFGVRLLAKALQINNSLETVIIDRNQVTNDGYSDLVHALKENFTLVSIPFPLADASEAVNRGEKAKTEKVLCKIEKLLFRNRAMKPRERPDKEEKSREAQSRLILSNVEEELNKAIMTGNRVMEDVVGLDTKSEQTNRIKTLLEDAEKAKELLSDSLSIDDSFVGDLVDKFQTDATQQLMLKLESFSGRAAKQPVEKGFSVCSDSGLEQQLTDVAGSSGKKLNIASPFSDLKAELCRTYKTATTECKKAVLERLSQEICTELVKAAQSLGTQTRTLSQNSLNQPQSPSPTTPQAKRRAKGGKERRPNSVIQATDVMAASDNRSINSSMDEADVWGSTDLGPVPEEQTEVPESHEAKLRKVTDIQKSKPKNPRKRYTKPPLTPTQTEFSEGMELFVAGMDKSATETPVRSSDTPPLPPKDAKMALLPKKMPASVEKPAVKEVEIEIAEPSSPVRALPERVELLKSGGHKKTNTGPPPRVPPNTPATPLLTPIEVKEGIDLALACRFALESNSGSGSENGLGTDTDSPFENTPDKLETDTDSPLDASSDKVDDDWLIVGHKKEEPPPKSPTDRSSLPEKPVATAEDTPKLPERNSVPVGPMPTPPVRRPPNMTPPGLPPKPGSMSKEALSELPQIRLRSVNKQTNETNESPGRLMTSKSGEDLSAEQAKEQAAQNRKSVMDLTARFETKTSRPQPAPRRNKIAPTQLSDVNNDN